MSMFRRNNSSAMLARTIGDLASAGLITPDVTLGQLVSKVGPLQLGGGKPFDTGAMGGGGGGLAELMDAPVVQITADDVAKIAQRHNISPDAIVSRFREAILAVTTNPAAKWADVKNNAPGAPVNAFYEPFGLGWIWVGPATNPGAANVAPGTAKLTASTVKAIRMSKLILQVMDSANLASLAVGSITISGRTYSQQGLIPGTCWQMVDAFPNFNGVVVEPALPVQIELFNFSGTGANVMGAVLGATQD